MRRPKHLKTKYPLGEAGLRPAKRSTNEPETALIDSLESDGWTVTKRGWPDFIAIRNGKVVIVEVKPNARHKARREQQFVMQLLADAGLNVALWSPDAGYRRVMPATQDPPLQ